MGTVNFGLLLPSFLWALISLYGLFAVWRLIRKAERNIRAAREADDMLARDLAGDDRRVYRTALTAFLLFFAAGMVTTLARLGLDLPGMLGWWTIPLLIIGQLILVSSYYLIDTMSDERYTREVERLRKEREQGC